MSTMHPAWPETPNLNLARQHADELKAARNFLVWLAEHGYTVPDLATTYEWQGIDYAALETEEQALMAWTATWNAEREELHVARVTPAPVLPPPVPPVTQVARQAPRQVKAPTRQWKVVPPPTPSLFDNPDD